MENSQGSSFIPKSPVRATKPRGTRRVFIFTYITFVFFFGTIIATIGIFIWGITIDKQLVAQKVYLATERESFNQADLESVRELETRMNTAYNILNRHVSVHSIFEALELTTLRSVQVVGFEYIKDMNNSLNLSLLLSTSNFNSSLFQREVFSGNSVLSGAQVSELTFTDTVVSNDGVFFSNPSKVMYQVEKKLSVSDIPYVVSASPSNSVVEMNMEEVLDVSQELFSNEEIELFGAESPSDLIGDESGVTDVNNQVGI